MSSNINDAFLFGRIRAPKQWYGVDRDYIDMEAPTEHPYKNSGEKWALNVKIRAIRNCYYTPDKGKDTWVPYAYGDCEDKCLKLIGDYRGHDLFKSMRLAICDIPRQGHHAVILLYTKGGTRVIDPTLSTMVVPWERYPVNEWLMRHSRGFLWENFKEKPDEKR